jgi:general secretion pathway protein G
MSPFGPPSAGYPASARWHVFRSPDSDFSPRPIRVHPSPFAGQHSPLRASAPLREISLCVASFAPAHVALRAAFGRLPGQRPLARVPVSAFRFPVSSSPAFTLIELLVTVTVIAILAGITLAAMGGVNQKATRDKTKAEVTAISNALEQFKSVRDDYPTNSDTNNFYPLVMTNDVNSIQPFFIANKIQTSSSNQLLDSYGNAYLYKKPGTKNPASFDVFSRGRDGLTNTSDDIGNW